MFVYINMGAAIFIHVALELIFQNTMLQIE